MFIRTVAIKEAAPTAVGDLEAVSAMQKVPAANRLTCQLLAKKLLVS
jgi:hypothetical protein